MRPLWYDFPDQEDLFAEQRTFMLGPALLSAPVMEAGASAVTVQFPRGPTWYNADTGSDMATAGNGNLQVPVTAASMPRCDVVTAPDGEDFLSCSCKHSICLVFVSNMLPRIYICLMGVKPDMI